MPNSQSHHTGRRTALVLSLAILGLASLFWLAWQFAIPAIQLDLNDRANRQLLPMQNPKLQVVVEGQAVLLFGIAESADQIDQSIAEISALPGVVEVSSRATVPVKLDTANGPSADSLDEQISHQIDDQLTRSTSERLLAQQCEASIATKLQAEPIKFVFSQFEIDPYSQATIAELANMVSTCGFDIEVAGHTDNMGDPLFNQMLSEQRANAVRELLITQGLKAESIQARGYGSAQPIADNGDRTGRGRNRRIEFRIIDRLYTATTLDESL